MAIIDKFSNTSLWKLVKSSNDQDVTGTPSVPDLPRSSEGIAHLEGGALHPMWTPVLQHLPGHRPQVWLRNCSNYKASSYFLQQEHLAMPYVQKED